MKALNKKELFDLIDDTFPGEYTLLFEDEIAKLFKEKGEDWFYDWLEDKWVKGD